MPTTSISGAGYLLKGVHLISQPGLKRFAIIPLLVNILVFSAAIYLGLAQFDGFIAWMESKVPDWLSWLEWILWPLFVISLLIITFYTFTLVANLIASPFNSLLAEKVELHLTGKPLSEGGGIGQAMKELVPTLMDEVRKILYALLWAIPFLILAFVPVVGPVIWFLFSAWLLTVQYCDYPMGNNRLKFDEMRAMLRKRRVLSLSFGAATAGLTMIPILNFITMPSAVAGATAMWVGELKKRQEKLDHNSGP